jgi:hypothetical protein
MHAHRKKSILLMQSERSVMEQSWNDSSGIWYAIDTSTLHKILNKFSYYTENKLHKLRLKFLNFSLNSWGIYNYLGFPVKTYIADNHKGEYRYIIQYQDKKSLKRVNIYGKLPQSHFFYLKKKILYPDQALDNRDKMVIL